MAMMKRERINIAAPALRMLAAGDGPPALVRYEAEPAAGAVMLRLADDADAPGEIVAQLREALPAGSAAPEAVTIEGLGGFTITPPPATTGRLAGKVAVVTGAARGIGRRIAEDLAGEGAVVALADINARGTRAVAEQLNETYGQHRALGVEMDVTSTASVAAGFDRIVQRFGGLDLLVANAGVLMAGNIKTQPPEDFDAVTAVNYRGYFLCVRTAAPILAVQHMARPAWTGDIIQINSKSGLAGSNRNAAYAGSKFGGLGLTQSFALELIGDGVKVNAICPGNFFDGPLWSDGETGLFVQYLRAGKVPGARTIEDVRRAYEAKVPMGRGCTAADIMKAIYYLVEQQYETGQALPVTGGQVMLK